MPLCVCARLWLIPSCSEVYRSSGLACVYMPVSETYDFQLLHCFLTHVHPSGLLHLHQPQVLQGENTNRDASDSVFFFQCLNVLETLTYQTKTKN